MLHLLLLPVNELIKSVAEAELNAWYDQRYAEFEDQENYYHCCGRY